MSEPLVPIEALGQTIVALEAQRAVLGDAVVDAALAPLRKLLAEQRANVPRRRQVSVLFLDIVGSTALSRTLDPEDVHDIVDSALQGFSACVVERGGKVLQYAGDSLLAAFGSEAAREDDAERAVHAGLDLLAEARTQAERVERLHGQSGFGVRVGVHTGQVLLGGGVDEDGTIRGFTVNIAARLEQTAPPGRLRISHETLHHVRGVFEVEAQPPLLVKGQDEPLRTYLVARPRPRAFRVPTRGIEGAQTPLVGRDNELKQLVAAFEGAAESKNLHAVTVVAEAGLGKSRLLQELQHRLETHQRTAWLLLGRSQPGSTLQPYGLVRDVLAWRLQIADSDPADVARKRLVDGLAPLFETQGELQAELIGQLVGMDFSASPRLQGVLNEPRLLRDRAFAAFVTYLRRLAASDNSMVVMLLDDLQWSDDASLDWLLQLSMSDDLPLALIMAARPALLERRPAWDERAMPRERHRRLTLAMLDAAQRADLTAALLSRLPEVPDALRTLIDTQAEGNPFYAEELVKMLIDDGVIEVSGAHWQLLPERLSRAHVPSTLTGVIQARLDALAAADRRALQMASIVGPVFWDAALSTLDAAAPQSLPALQHKAMVQLHPQSAFEGSREAGFNHHLLHQVTYDTVLKAERRAGHAHAAQWLAARVGDREAEYLAITAEHYERGGDQERAADWFWRAVKAAQNRFANRTALAYLERLLAMPDLSTSRRFDANMSVANSAGLLTDTPLHRQALQDANAIAEQQENDTWRARVANSEALLADRLDDTTQAFAHATRAVEAAERAGSASQLALAHGELCWLASHRGEFDVGRRHLEIGLQAARRAARDQVKPDDDMYEIQLQLVAAQLYELDRDLEGRGEAVRTALALAQSNRYPRVHASCHEYMALLAIDLCDFDTATRHIDHFDTLAHHVGGPIGMATVPRLRGRLAMAVGDHQQAFAYSAAAAEAYRRIGSHAWHAYSLVQQADAQARVGDIAGSQTARQQALELYESIDAQAGARACRLLIADGRRVQGELTLALSQVQAEFPTLAQAGVFNDTYSSLGARMAGWRVLNAAGNTAEAQRQLELAWAELQRDVHKLTDPAVRKQIFDGSELHREIVAAYAMRFD